MPFPHDLPLTLVQSPCKGCTERHQYCHGKCEKYADFRACCDELAAERQQEGEIYEYLEGVLKRMPGRRNL